MKPEVNIFWFRRDLRLEDNAGLYHALKDTTPVLPIFIFDPNILTKLSDKKDARVTFIHDTITNLGSELTNLGSAIKVFHTSPLQAFKELIETYSINKVYSNRDYEPYAKKRDDEVSTFLKEQKISFHDFKDHVIFEKSEVIKDDGKPYTVFSPYGRKWRAKLKTRISNQQNTSFYFTSYPTSKYHNNFHQTASFQIPSLSDMGFSRSEIEIPSKIVSQKIIKEYSEKRNFPYLRGTSRLGIHFRFGTISIREKARKAEGLNDTYLNELIWRDFYSMILDHFPKVEKEEFRDKYAGMELRNNEEEFKKWCEGNTGYPLVDAGMRELNQTGFMHNRVRMLVASFLTKHLLIDWRWGEAYFAEKLLDFDLSSNNGGWQWAAGCGTDAAPYFRIFNPTSQLKKFDPNLEYVKKWIPEYGTSDYPLPIVDHKFARARCLDTYKSHLNGFVPSK